MVETQPATNNAGVPVIEGCEKAGTGGGTTSVNTITGIAVVSSGSAINNDFYECPSSSQTPGTIQGYVYCYTESQSPLRGPQTSPYLVGVAVNLTGKTTAGSSSPHGPSLTAAASLPMNAVKRVPAGASASRAGISSRA